MSIVDKFLNKIFILLDEEPSHDDFDNFNDLEDWFLDNAESLAEENEYICNLGDLMQDEISKMSYMVDNSVQINNIKKIYERMQEIYKGMQNN